MHLNNESIMSMAVYVGYWALASQEFGQWYGQKQVTHSATRPEQHSQDDSRRWSFLVTASTISLQRTHRLVGFCFSDVGGIHAGKLAPGLKRRVSSDAVGWGGGSSKSTHDKSFASWRMKHSSPDLIHYVYHNICGHSLMPLSAVERRVFFPPFYSFMC